MLQDSPIIPYIPVSDLARARKCYEEIIGLTPTHEANGGMVYRCGNDSEVFMYVSMGAGTSNASQAFWQVTALAAEMAAAPWPRGSRTAKATPWRSSRAPDTRWALGFRS